MAIRTGGSGADVFDASLLGDYDETNQYSAHPATTRWAEASTADALLHWLCDGRVSCYLESRA